jgi:hypothetical protein
MLSAKNTFYILSWIIVVLAAIACAGGLFIRGLYHDNELIKTAWYGNDIVTLVVAVPILIIAMIHSLHGSERAQLVWIGMLSYMVYNYAFYLFGAAFNAFFLLHTALFATSVYALILGLTNLDVEAIGKHFSVKTPVRWLSVFLLFISIPLGVIEISHCLHYIISGETPHIPTLIFALDLSIVIPNTALAAILLWRYHAWGYILGAIMLLKAFTYGTALSLSSLIAATVSISGYWDPLMPYYLFVALGGLIGSFVLLSNLFPTTTS